MDRDSAFRVSSTRFPDFRMHKPKRSYFAYISALLGVLSLIGVLCFHFPELLTSKEFRTAYTEDFARNLLLVGLVTAFVLGTFAILRGRNRRVAMLGVGCATLAVLLGGTFMGIAGLSQWLARVPDPQATARRIGFITACYGVGQIVGPLLVAVRGRDAGFAMPVLSAAVALLASAVLLEISRRRERLG